MDSYTHYSDFQSLNPPATSSLSDSGSTYRAAVSDEEVILASSRPKKRAGRKKFRETRHPVYRGVRERNGNWVCEMREPNKKSRIWLGTFLTAEMAARAHDVAALALRGRLACLNFADSAWRLPVPVSTDAKDIQKAAAEAAESFRPSKSDEMCCDTVRASKSEGMCFDTAQSEKAKTAPESIYYVDDETLFEMPRLLNNMAEGLLISPPYLDGRFSCEDMEGYADLSLWSYSV